MKRFVITPILLFALLIPQIAFSLEADSAWYTDVEGNYVFHDAILYMTENGYVSGYPNGTFQADLEVNRAEALKMIINSSEVQLENSDIVLDFPDVNQDAWYYDYIKDAYALNIINGHDDGYFRPEDTVNRAEALKMILLTNNIDLGETDISAEWYESYINYGAEHALIIPDSEMNYLPGNPLSRGELAELIYRLKKDKFTGEVEYGQATYYGESFNGHGTASGTPLDTSKNYAAHKTLPFGTIVRVTNTDTNLFVDVEIIDRGPYTEGRVVDLTPSSFDRIGNLSSGILNVRVEVLN